MPYASAKRDRLEIPQQVEVEVSVETVFVHQDEMDWEQPLLGSLAEETSVHAFQGQEWLYHFLP